MLTTTAYRQFMKENRFDQIVLADFETTGLNPQKDFPTEFAYQVVHLTNNEIVRVESPRSFMIQLPEGVEVSDFITNLTGLTTDYVNQNGVSREVAKERIKQLFKGKITLFVAHNANFDIGFLAEHFGIDPAFFFCTKSIEFMADPNNSNSLKSTHARYSLLDVTQTHRAEDDVIMLREVFEAQLHSFTQAEIDANINRMVITPERPPVYTPKYAKVVDFSKVFVTRKAYEKQVEENDRLLEDSETLSRLEAYGVDNWSGYSEAMSDSMGMFE